MAKYIKCEAALALVRPDDPNDERCAVTVATAKRLIRHILTATPAADVAPVVHGRWIENGSGIIICPKWNRGYNLVPQFTHYCPNCGAKMDGGGNDEVD